MGAERKVDWRVGQGRLYPRRQGGGTLDETGNRSTHERKNLTWDISCFYLCPGAWEKTKCVAQLDLTLKVASSHSKPVWCLTVSTSTDVRTAQLIVWWIYNHSDPCLNQIEYAQHWGRRWSKISPTPSFMWERLALDNELKQGSLSNFKLAVAHRNSVIENNLKSLALNTAGSQMNLRCAADWHQARTDRQTHTST